jgi:hypothetical protein
MNSDNVTDIRAHRLADLIMAEWLDSQSDGAALWKRSHDALVVAKGEHSEEVFAEAVKIARERWGKMFNVEA